MVLPVFQRLLPFFGCLFFAAVSFAQLPNRFDVVIDELLPDPSPPVQLPNAEFIELKNVSTTAYNIRNWKLSDGSTTATIAIGFTLQPDSFVIVCPNSAVDLFAGFGTTIGVSNFPSLNNEADVIALYASDGRLVHTVGYNTSWYQNAVKSDGGWSLEMIDTRNPCAGTNNWKASTGNIGGTPGKKNAVDYNNPDEQPPALIRTTTTDSITISAWFEEPVDSNSAVIPENYTINNGVGHPVSANLISPLCTEVALNLATTLNNQLVYGLTVLHVKDCAGNAINQLNTAKAGLPVMADSQFVVINEILFNPPPNGFDYVEIYNRSNRVIDLKQLYLATRNGTRQLTGITPLYATSWLLFPGEYRVLTENKYWLQQQYLIKDPDLIIELSALPSLPDDKGTLVLLNMQGIIVDELQYDHNWHFGLINDEEGIALERINYNGPTQDRSNWASAASTTGFGTPGYPNSQLMGDAQIQGQVTINPAVFSPDNDGFNDFAVIDYQLPEPGVVANIRIYDANGRLVRYLVQGATLSATGRFRWDGLGDRSNKLPIGTYIVLTELFNAQGRKKKFKQTVTLARRF
ncbi:hypothetical protein A4H97_28715 [Niastella yeongjuensis]|uniref:LTD domain-containing protein n=1 Tax=Niastella yeongjuensis TaxID=354355 RepID=A0A1V9EU08_9BACT|nr:lamin tail domain-containing protein [Niastella yeongjuensis]OQP49325.1 hypothetical protein A4H97_28715 [Niastella yeongjuensis]SEP43260.1 C-terminal domain of CHU protein family protein [Niastella yeongjuensis]